MGVFYQAYRLIHHWLNEQSEHSAQSPALYKFYTDVILNDVVKSHQQEIENARTKFLKTRAKVKEFDFGSGSQIPIKTRTVSGVSDTSITPARWSRLLCRLLQYNKVKHILELGTCLGINALYISNDPEVKLWTIEGNPQLASLSEEVFKINGRKNIILIQGEIDKHLDAVLNSMSFVDLAFLDANHRYQPTLKYGTAIWAKLKPGRMLIADDINRSSEMRRAWTELSQLEDCSAVIDLYRWGILVKGPSELTGNHIWHY